VFKRILVTGAGGPGALNLSRSLLTMRPSPWILAADASKHYVFLALGNERALVPRASDSDAYIAAINRLIDTHRVDFVMPNNSLEIRVLSARRSELHAPVFLPDVAALDKANSKWLSYQAFQEAGLPVPKTVLLREPSAVHDVFRSLQTQDEERVWVRGAGIPGKGIGVASLPCRTSAQAEQWVEYWHGWGEMAASEYLPGDNLTWMGLFKAGELVTSQGRRRLAYVIPHVSPSGITGAPAISETVSNPVINRLGPAAVRSLDAQYTGVAFVDFKGDADGHPRITEVNAGRFGTTHFFYSAAGANFPEFLLRLAAGEPLDLPKEDILPEGLMWIRTLDAGPVLTTRAAIESGDYPSIEGQGARWPLVPQSYSDFEEEARPMWPPEPTG
jgi:biotin carboxylase